MSGIGFRKCVALLLATTVITGCGGGGGGSGGGGDGAIVVPPSAPAPTPPPPPPAPTPTPPPPTGSFAANAAALYDVAPDLAACRASTLKASVKAQALADINAIRARHGLAPVVYSDADDAQTAEASLMMAANNALSHTPPTSWRCYTSIGATGAGSSNLLIGWGNGLGFSTSDLHLAGWLHEGGSASLGHRRWILHPFLGKFSYGRVTVQGGDGSRIDAGTMKVFSFTGGRPAPSTVPSFVAFPFGDYPIRYFRPTDYLSFSIAPSSADNGSDRQVDFSAARVSVMNGATAMTVTDLSRDNDGYGLANNLQWRVSGLQTGVTYNVRITGVARAPQSEYSYSFRIAG